MKILTKKHMWARSSAWEVGFLALRGTIMLRDLRTRRSTDPWSVFLGIRKICQCIWLMSAEKGIELYGVDRGLDSQERTRTAMQRRVHKQPGMIIERATVISNLLREMTATRDGTGVRVQNKSCFFS